MGDIIGQGPAKETDVTAEGTAPVILTATDWLGLTLHTCFRECKASRWIYAMLLARAARTDLEALSKAALVQRILQLQGALDPAQHAMPVVEAATGGKTRKRKRDFDFSRWNTRHIALRIAYQGMRFDGLARQVSISRD